MSAPSSGLDACPRTSIDTRLGRMSYRRGGAGPALLLLHGIGGNADSWRQQFPAFAPRHDVVAWDAPGYADSFTFAVDAPRVEAYAEAAIALLDALGIRTTAVLGHSMGGLIAGCAAALHPERFSRVILSDCSSGHATYPKEKREQMLATRLAGLAGGDATDYARKRAPGVLSSTPAPEHVEEAIGILSQLKVPGFPQASRMVSEADLFPFLARVSVPSRVLCGTDDRVTPEDLNRRIAAAMPRADYVALEGAGHWSFLERPAPFNDAVLQFLTQR